MNFKQTNQNQGNVYNTEIKHVSGPYVWSWPELRALATRLGVDLSKKTTRLTVDIANDSVVRIQHEFLGEDHQ